MCTKEHREQKLLLYLSKNPDYVTADSLAEILQTSQKTVYRLVKTINDESEYNPLIISERGRGYKLDYEKFIKHQRTTLNYKKDIFTPTERRKRIMEELLLSSPVPLKIEDLFYDFFVGESVIFTDEQIMSETLGKYSLVLERKNRTLTIIGEEMNIRKAIKDIIEIFNVIDIDELKTNQELNFNKDDVLFIFDQIRNIEKKLDRTIPYPYNINIFSHLYILISRSRNKKNMNFSEEITSEQVSKLQQDMVIYQSAESVVRNMEIYLDLTLPETEVYFLYQYLVSSRMQGTFDITSNLSTRVIDITNVYIDEMSKQIGMNTNNHTIFMDLANHIKPMLNRLDHNIQVRNNLLDQIKITYEDLFSGVTKVSEYISEYFHLPAINDDENGFITLYFAKLIETNQHKPPIRTIIMCTTGIGTSELLKVKASRSFPELDIVDVIPSRDIQLIKRKHSSIDLILSTINIEEDISIPSLLVSAMFTLDDKKRLQKKIEAINNER